ncbi:hypothetical protein EXIGLDRAFT_718460 [Exidia glandulosa HHB12029]|uniref:Uncharacterized protein n=1 Tax=Exidia glandulosa HHB12029 TaxID=1314781 RepID=A0A165NWG5_EXIGL|nr:hypothetical protein EXIGLDRAFT_718460 [Exidia glandulosa HHB12029]
MVEGAGKDVDVPEGEDVRPIEFQFIANDERLGPLRERGIRGIDRWRFLVQNDDTVEHRLYNISNSATNEARLASTDV